MTKWKKFLKKAREFLVKHGVLEPMFDTNYPRFNREYVTALTEYADSKKNQRFLCDSETGKCLWRYKFHPLKGTANFFHWLFQTPGARN